MSVIKGLATGDYPNTGRLEALTDAVFAIVMTILVIEIGLSEATGSSEQMGLGQRLIDTLPQFYAYILSFLVLALYWYNHHFTFNLIKRIDGIILWLNILFLMSVALIPFSTSVLGNYENSQTAFIFYGCNLLVINLIIFVLFLYITRKKHLRDSNVDMIYRMKKVKVVLWPNLAIITGMGITFLSVEWARYLYLGFLVMMILFTLPNAFGLSKSLFFKEDKAEVEDDNTQ